MHILVKKQRSDACNSYLQTQAFRHALTAGFFGVTHTKTTPRPDNQLLIVTEKEWRCQEPVEQSILALFEDKVSTAALCSSVAVCRFAYY